MKKVIALAGLCLLPYTYASAEGYQVNAQSTRQGGMGHVGTAMKLGAESMHFNPAGLGFLDKQIDISAGVTGVFAKATFKDGDYKHQSDNDPSTPLFAYAGFKIYDFLSAGISINNPYGSSIDWGKNWKGAHLIQDISLKAFSVQPTLAWKITDRLSVGAGMMIMFGNIELNRSFISSADLAAVAMANPNAAPLAEKYKDITPLSVGISGSSDIRLGYNVGAMFDINDKVTIGASFRSKVNMKVAEGDVALTYANEMELKPVLEGVPPLDRAYFHAQLPLPSNFNIGVSYQPTTQWILSGEVQFVGWGAYEKLDIHFIPENTLGIYDQSARKEYKNTRIYRLGAQYGLTSRMDLRLGAYLDETPVKDDYLNPETPSMNKLGLSAGFSFRPVDRFSIDLSFTYVTGFGRDGSYTDKSLVTGMDRNFGGHYQTRAYMPSIGLRYLY